MTADNPAPSGVALDRVTAKRLVGVVRNFWRSELGGRAALLAGLLLALLLAINGLNVVNSYVGRNFMTAIERRDSHEFFNQALFYAAVFAASTIVAVISRFIEERLGLMWRESFTRRLSTIYLERHFFYHLKVAGRLENPDQRIADDIRSFTTTTLSLALIFLNGTLTVLAFSGVLWSISRLLFATAVVYAALGSVLAYATGRPLIRLNYDQSDREANFRTQLVHIRENAESIALLGQEGRLRTRLYEQIGAFAANLKRIIAVNRNLGFFITGYNYMIQLIPALIVAPLFIRGTVEFGVIPQAAMAFAQLIGAFSLIVNQFPQLSSYAAVLARLNALGEAFQSFVESDAGIAVVEDESRFAFEDLTLVSPHDGRPLVRGLSLELPAGARLLIAAADAVVPGALLRAVAGLWQSGTGRVVRPGRDKLFLLPERPYLPPGTLREILAGDADSATGADDRVLDALRRVGAEVVVQRAGGLDVGHDWNAMLSLDEQRLVEVAQILMATPRVAILADPGSGFGPARAVEVLEALAERRIGFVVLGHGAIDRRHFDMVVEIAPDGTWTRAGGAQ